MVENDRWKRKEDLEHLADPVERTLAECLKLCYIEGKKKKKGWFLDFFNITFTIHRTAGEGGGHFQFLMH